MITWAKAALPLQGTQHAAGQLCSSTIVVGTRDTREVNNSMCYHVSGWDGVFFLFWVSHSGLFWIQLHGLICLLVRMFIFPGEKKNNKCFMKSSIRTKYGKSKENPKMNSSCPRAENMAAVSQCSSHEGKFRFCETLHTCQVAGDICITLSLSRCGSQLSVRSVQCTAGAQACRHTGWESPA